MNSSLLDTLVGVIGLAVVTGGGYFFKRLVDQLDRVTNHLEQLNNKFQTLDTRLQFVENKIKPEAKDGD